MYLPAGISVCPGCGGPLALASATLYHCDGCGRVFDIEYDQADYHILSWVSDTLAVGSLAQAQNPQILELEKVGSLLSCRDPEPGPCREFADRCEFAPLKDGKPIPDGYLQRVTDWLIYRLRCQQRILVYCAAGQSRSVTVAAVTMVRMGLADTFDRAVETIRDVRPKASPHPVLRQSARAYLHER